MGDHDEHRLEVRVALLFSYFSFFLNGGWVTGAEAEFSYGVAFGPLLTGNNFRTVSVALGLRILLLEKNRGA